MAYSFDILILAAATLAAVLVGILVLLVPGLVWDALHRVEDAVRVRRRRRQLQREIRELARQTEFLAAAALEATVWRQFNLAACYRRAAALSAGRAFGLAPVLARLQS
jgi:hypothetical protein